MTKKRERIIGSLLTMDRPASAEEIRKRAGLNESDLVTVYRNLDTFESSGILQRIPLENGTHLFELVAPDEHFHHIICRECHRAQRLDICLGEEFNQNAKSFGYSHIEHVLEIYGLCSKCANS